MARTKALDRPDPFRLYPVRLHGFEAGSQGEAVILLPRYGVSWIGRFYRKLLGKPYIRLPLDERGTFFWQLCDGTRDLRAICDLLVERFGAAVEPVEDRGLTMLRTLLHQGCLKLLREPLDRPQENAIEGVRGAGR